MDHSNEKDMKVRRGSWEDGDVFQSTMKYSWPLFPPPPHTIIWTVHHSDLLNFSQMASLLCRNGVLKWECHLGGLIRWWLELMALWGSRPHNLWSQLDIATNFLLNICARCRRQKLFSNLIRETFLQWMAMNTDSGLPKRPRVTAEDWTLSKAFTHPH